jgi:hypothetical protein
MTSEKEKVRQFWDEILDIMLERINRKSVPVKELAHVTDELRRILAASKGKLSIWGSVIDVALVLLTSDAQIHDFKRQTRYNESTIYRALARLEAAGFAEAQKGEDLAQVGPASCSKPVALAREKVLVSSRGNSFIQGGENKK